MKTKLLSIFVLCIILFCCTAYAGILILHGNMPAVGTSYDYSETVVITDSSYDMGGVHHMWIDGNDLFIAVVNEGHGQASTSRRSQLVEVDTDDLDNEVNVYHNDGTGSNFQAITGDDTYLYMCGFIDDEMFINKITRSDWSTKTFKRCTEASITQGQNIYLGVDYDGNDRIYVVGDQTILAVIIPTIWTIDPDDITVETSEHNWYYSQSGNLNGSMWHDVTQDPSDKALYVAGLENLDTGEWYATITKLSVDADHDVTAEYVNGVTLGRGEVWQFDLLFSEILIDSSDGDVIWALGHTENDAEDGYNILLGKFDISTNISVTNIWEISDSTMPMIRGLGFDQDDDSLFISVGYVPHSGIGSSDEYTLKHKHSAVILDVAKSNPTTVNWCRSFGGHFNGGFVAFGTTLYDNGHLYVGGWTDAHDANGTVRANVTRIDVDRGGQNDKFMLYDSSDLDLSSRRYGANITISLLSSGTDYTTYIGDGESVGSMVATSSGADLSTYSGTWADRKSSTSFTTYTYDYENSYFDLIARSDNNTSCTIVGSGMDDNYEAVNDEYYDSPDDTTTYIKNNSETHYYDLYGHDFDADDATGMSISSVVMHFRARASFNTASWYGVLEPNWKIGAESQVEGTDQNLDSVTWTNFTETVTNASWTLQELEDTVFGYDMWKRGGIYAVPYNTRVFLRVNYTE